jgi:DNA-binding CsgD family transcriptional regulator
MAAMTLSHSNPKILPSPLPLSYASQRLNRIHTDLVSSARMWAVEEVGAAMAHQLNEPLTALLLYLHEIKERDHPSDAGAVSNSREELVERALHETQRVCDIMEQMGNGFEGSVEATVRIPRRRDSTDWLVPNGDVKEGGLTSTGRSRSGQHYLTPREREVLALITGGASNKEGGRELGITTRTFEVHRAHIMAKLGARNAADLVRMALSEKR